MDAKRKAPTRKRASDPAFLLLQLAKRSFLTRVEACKDFDSWSFCGGERLWLMAISDWTYGSVILRTSPISVNTLRKLTFCLKKSGHNEYQTDAENSYAEEKVPSRSWISKAQGDLVRYHSSHGARRFSTSSRRFRGRTRASFAFNKEDCASLLMRRQADYPLKPSPFDSFQLLDLQS